MCDSVVLWGILGRGVTLIYSVSHTELTYFLSNIMELDFYFMEKHCCSHGKSTQEVLILRQSKVFAMRDFPNAQKKECVLVRNRQ